MEGDGVSRRPPAFGRAGLVHVSSMMAVETPPRVAAFPSDDDDAPHKSHWSRTCDHDPVPRLKRYESGVVRASLQCRKCGQRVGQQVPMAGVTEDWDDALEEGTQEDYRKAVAEHQRRRTEWYSAQRRVCGPQWWRAYNAYLRTSVWQLKRTLVLERAGGICEACGQRNAEQVHHLSYPHTFGLEPLWDLRAVCLPCHKIIHPHMED